MGRKMIPVDMKKVERDLKRSRTFEKVDFAGKYIRNQFMTSEFLRERLKDVIMTHTAEYNKSLQGGTPVDTSTTGKIFDKLIEFICSEEMHDEDDVCSYFGDIVDEIVNDETAENIGTPPLQYE